MFTSVRTGIDSFSGNSPCRLFTLDVKAAGIYVESLDELIELVVNEFRRTLGTYNCTVSGGYGYYIVDFKGGMVRVKNCPFA